MDQRHSRHQRNHTGHHHLVLGEEALDANIAAAKSRNNYSQRENSRPPADEQGRIGLILGLVVWRNLRIENHIIIVAVEPPLEEKPEAAHIVRLKLGLVKRNERNVFVCEEEKEYRHKYFHARIHDSWENPSVMIGFCTMRLGYHSA